MTPQLGNFWNLAGPDLIVICIIILVLAGIPAAIALPIVFILDRRSKEPPPLSPVMKPPASTNSPSTPQEGP